VADTVIVPLQDVLGLGSVARMNVPGVPRGNWAWRVRPGEVGPQVRAMLAEITAVYGRWNGTVPDRYAPPRPLKKEAPAEPAAPATKAPRKRAATASKAPKKPAKASSPKLAATPKKSRG
jgi:hypothetical protein